MAALLHPTRPIQANQNTAVSAIPRTTHVKGLSPLDTVDRAR